MENFMKRMNLLVMLLALMTIVAGCTKEPPEEVGYGEDHNLFSKEALLGYAISNADVKKEFFTGKSRLGVELPSALKSLVKKIDDFEKKKISFDISKSFLTVNVANKATLVPYMQYEIDHYDLKNAKTKSGKKTQYLEQNDEEESWQKRKYIEATPDSQALVKASDETLHGLFLKSDFEKAFSWGDEIPVLDAHPKARAELLQLTGAKVEEGSFHLTKESQVHAVVTQSVLYFYVNGVVIARYNIAGHFDLEMRKNAAGEKTAVVEKTQLGAEWSERAYIQVDAEEVALMDLDAMIYKTSDRLALKYETRQNENGQLQFIEVANSTIQNLFKKSDLSSATKWSQFIPVVDHFASTRETLDNLSGLKLGGDKAVFTLDKDSVIKPVIKQDYLYFYHGDVALVRYSIKGHYDLEIKNIGGCCDKGELKATQDTQAWDKRTHIAVDPEAAEIINFSESFFRGSEAVVNKASLESCKKVSELAPISLQKAVLGLDVAPSQKVCFGVGTYYLSVYKDLVSPSTCDVTKMIANEGCPLAGVMMVEHINIAQKASPAKPESPQVTLSMDVTGEWNKRSHIKISLPNAKIVENIVSPDALKKTVFEGQYVYSATVVAAHSENGELFEGLSSQSSDRVEFVFSENFLTAYKANDLLNDSAAPAPVLRFPVRHFDIERSADGEGATVFESTKQKWNKRAFVDVAFGSQLIKNYFSDLLGFQKYMGSVSISQPIAAYDIEVKDDVISFETEEVMTPNLAAGNIGSGETILEPTSVRIKHSFVRVDNRSYEKREYDEHDQMSFGYFLTTSLGIDPLKGKTDDSVNRYINKFDIGDQKHIDYYLSEGFPAEHVPLMREVVAAWNVAFAQATKSEQLPEGRKNVVRLIEGVYPEISNPLVNMIVWIPTRAEWSPLGYGPSFKDPLTGEIISSKAYIYGDVVSRVRQNLSDYIDVARGKDPLVFAKANLSVGPTKQFEGLNSIGQKMPKTNGAVKNLTRKAGESSQSFASKVSKMKKHAPIAESDLLKDVENLGDKVFAHEKSAESKLVSYNRVNGCAIGEDFQLASAKKYVDASPEKSKEELLDEIVKRMIFTTTLHEVGHNLGLRHNFHGTYDPLNFPAQFHKLAKEKKDPAEERGPWLEEYRTSSVMDYADDFEAVYKFAGPYDVAAIKFGYGNKLEVLKDENGDGIYDQNEDGSFVSEDISADVWRKAARDILAANPEASANAAYAVAKNQLGVRPFKFCTDEHVWDDPTCNRFDRGITISEITANRVEDYDSMYYMQGFRRGRRSFTGSSHYVLDRWLMPVRQIMDEYIYGIVTGSFAQRGPGSQQDYLQAFQIGLGFYMKVLSAIEPGDYHFDEETKEFVSGAKEGAKTLNVSLKDGKYLRARFANVGFEERALSRGVETDKLYTLMLMSMRGYPAKKYRQASLYLNYFDLLGEFTLERFSDFITDDFKVEVTAKVGEDGGLTLVSSSADEGGSGEVVTGLIPVNTSLALKEYAKFFAALEYNSESKRDFGEYVDYRLKGKDALLPDGVEKVEFTSASGTLVYQVPNSKDGLSISYKLAKRASLAAQAASKAQAELDSRPGSDVLIGQAVATFVEAFKVATGQDLSPNDIANISSAFPTYHPDIVGMFESWLANLQDEQARLKVEELKTKFDTESGLALNAEKEIDQLEGQIADSEADLRSIEADLISLKKLYDLFW